MQRRAAIGVAFLIWTLFIVADWLMVDIRLHPNLFEQLLGVRLGMIGLLLVVWPAAFLPSLRKVGDAIAPYCLLLINLAVLACDVLFEWHGVPRFTQLGATLGILAVFFPLGLAFWACVRLALLCLALNLAVFLLFGGEENLRTNLLNTLYNGLVVLICSFALYLQDYAQREQFLGRRLLGMMAEQDSLTGLVNRRYYELLAQRALEQGAREEKGVALILVDVDDFQGLQRPLRASGRRCRPAPAWRRAPAGRAAAAGYRRAPGRGGVRRVALRQRGGQHPGHRRAPAAGGGGAGHRAPGLQRRPCLTISLGWPIRPPAWAWTRSIARPIARSTRPRMQGATRCAWRSVSTTASNRGNEKGARGRLLSYGAAQPWLGILQSCRL
ncbi:GGDEF domain-containing protein [Pseudomonas aeruginosa]|nr:GGDEF domain-containing protein [Pseudomonas aeruginosa]